MRSAVPGDVHRGLDVLRRLAQRNRVESAGSKLVAADAQQFLPQVAVMIRRDAAATSLRCRH
jgi:hypothetical protein